MKGSELLRTLAIAATHPDNQHAPRVPITRAEAQELLRLADLIEKGQDDTKTWLIKNFNVLPTVVGDDEGSSDALLYNLIHLLRDGADFKRYNYAPEQDAEIKQLLATRGIERL